MSEGLSLSVSVSRKVNLGNYESADFFLSVSGIVPGTTEEEIAALVENEGKIAYRLLAAELNARARGALAK